MALGRATQHACSMALLGLLAIGCSTNKAPGAPAEAEQRPASVYTVNYPLTYFAQRLAPEHVEVVFPAPTGVDPAFWKPTPDEIGQYQRASLILLNGAGYARWTRYATLPKSRVVVTAAGCRDAFLQTGEAVAHQHGPAGEHAHEGTAFTTWLDMRLARCQAGHVGDALDALHTKREALDHDLTELDTRLRGRSRFVAAKARNQRPVTRSREL